MWNRLIILFCVLCGFSAVLRADDGSYLGAPRIHIAGQFYADPSTVNNDPHHYAVDVERPAPWQDPRGQHNWQIRDCRVRSVIGPDGREVVGDPLIGIEVGSTDSPAIARIVDLDVYQQAVSTIHGFQLKFLLRSGTPLVGSMDPAVLNSARFDRVLPTRGWNLQYGWGSYGADNIASGFFQTVVRVPVAGWPVGHGSRVLDALREASDVVDGNVLLSFRFVLDNYMNIPSHQDFRLGRFTGAIGPGKAEQPAQTAGARWLDARAMPADAQWFVPKFYGGPFRVDAGLKQLRIDLGNCLCLDSPGGAPVDLGDLHAVVALGDGSYETIGEVDYSDFYYENYSGIAVLDLSDRAMQLLAEHPLALRMTREGIGPGIVLSERSDGLSYAADQRVFRLTSEADCATSEATTDVYVRRWGLPVSGVKLDATVIPVTGSTPGNTGTPGSPGDTLDALGALTVDVSPTDDRGVATVTMRAVKNTFNRTPELDGQMYFIYVHPDKEMFPDTDLAKAQSQERQISALVWSRYEVNENPEWAEIESIMQPYAKLYPAMTDLIDLTSRHAFDIYADNPPWVVFGEDPNYSVHGLSAGAIAYFLTRDINDPRYMPISRDLSPNKVLTVLNWIRNNQPKSGEGDQTPEGTPVPVTPIARPRLVEDAVPFTLTYVPIRHDDARALPPLQSYSSAVMSDGRWFIVGGRTLGLHTFNAATTDTLPEQGNFPPSKANHFMWVIDPEEGVVGKFDVRSLPEDLSAPLQATNQQAYYDVQHDEFLIAGGYGARGDEMLTFDTMIRLNPARIAEIITGTSGSEQKAARIASHIQMSQDEVFRVTGGSLERLGNAFYLVFGQKFMGEYSTFGEGRAPSDTASRTLNAHKTQLHRSGGAQRANTTPFDQQYTEQIRVFTLDPRTLEVLSYGPTDDDSPDRPFHRRDGNVLMTVDPASGRPVIAAFGGVFPPGMIAGYAEPIRVTGPGTYEVDRSYEQRFSQYECPVIVVYDAPSQTVYQTFFGGIGSHFYHQTPQQRQIYHEVALEGRNDGLPFIADISTLIHKADGSYVEYIMPQPVPGNRLLGASSNFLPVGDEITRLHELAADDEVVLGYIYGGIEAEAPLPKVPNQGTRATNTLFRVSLIKTPSQAIPAEGHAIPADATPGYREGE